MLDVNLGDNDEDVDQPAEAGPEKTLDAQIKEDFWACFEESKKNTSGSDDSDPDDNVLNLNRRKDFLKSIN